LITIKPGDVLKIDKALNQDMDIIIYDKLKFRGKPGLVGNQLA
jgi:flagellar motor switch protein FliM